MQSLQQPPTLHDVSTVTPIMHKSSKAQCLATTSHQLQRQQRLIPSLTHFGLPIAHTALAAAAAATFCSSHLGVTFCLFT
jgi:hypothetical protein